MTLDTKEKILREMKPMLSAFRYLLVGEKRGSKEVRAAIVKAIDDLAEAYFKLVREVAGSVVRGW